MDYKPKPFFNAVHAYPEFKDIFKKFCDMATKKLNGNEHLPNVTISVKADGASATLKALDRNFDISFRFLNVNNTLWGVIEASLPGETKEPVRLFHYLFDRNGNVFETLDRTSGFHSAFSTEFVIAFLDQLTEKYFFHLSGVLKLIEGNR